MSGKPFLRAAQAGGDHWGMIVKSALSALGPLPEDANFGLVHLTEALTEHLSSVLTFLRETTPIRQWAAAAGPGLIGPLGAVRDRASIALLAGRLPDQSFRMMDSWVEPRRGRFLADHRDWLDSQAMPVALVHGDAMDGALPEALEDLAATLEAFPVGGVTRRQPGGLSGMLLGAPLGVIAGLTQGCLPLGPSMVVTAAAEEVLMTLDGRPALEVMKEQIPPDIARDLQLAAGRIHVGLPVAGADRADYLVRSLLAIDPAHGWLAIGATLHPGQSLIFVQRDTESARRDMERMLDDLKNRAANRRILGGVYISCTARGAHMFGTDEAEPAMIAQILGDFPLIGLISHGEICHDRLYGYTGVLVLILE